MKDKFKLLKEEGVIILGILDEQTGSNQTTTTLKHSHNIYKTGSTHTHTSQMVD